MDIDRSPDPLVDWVIDEMARRNIADMTPLDMGLLLHPDATPKELADVPEAIITEYLTRYTRDDLRLGQFLEVSPGKYTFILSKETKRRLERKNTGQGK